MKIALKELYAMRFLLLGICVLGFGVCFLLESTLLRVIFGNLLGIVTVFFEFMLIGYNVETALEKHSSGQVISGYFGRMAMIAVLFYGTLQVESIGTLSFVVPLFYPRIAIYLSALKRKKGGE